MSSTNLATTNHVEADGRGKLAEGIYKVVSAKRLVLTWILGAAALAGAISWILPDEFRATTKILPPQQGQSGAAAILAQLGGVAGAAAGAAGVKNPNDLYVGMLRSRTIADNLIRRFDLKTVYDEDLMEYTRKELQERTGIVSGKDGLIVVDVDDRDRKRSTELANGYIEELLKLTNSVSVTEASHRRLFFERQLSLAKDRLAAAESSLKGNLERNGVASVDSQSRAIVETAGRLRAQISVREAQLEAMSAFVTVNNIDYKRLQQEIQSLRSQLSLLENGEPVLKKADDRQVSSAGLDNIKMLRDVKYFQMLYELLSKQYEVARLDEAKDASVIQVLDKAVEPERRHRPKRIIITIIGALLGLIFSLFHIFLRDSVNQLRAQVRTMMSLGSVAKERS